MADTLPIGARDRLRDLVASEVKHRGSQAAVARAADLSPTTLAQMLNGDGDIGASRLAKLCESLAVSMDYVLLGVGGPTGPDMALVPMHDIAFSAGYGADGIIKGTSNATAQFPEYWLREQFGKVEGLRLVKASGDSMEPTITDGQWVMIDIGRQAGDGIFAVRVWDDLFIKRLQFQTTRVLAISDNPSYEIFVINLKDKADREAFQVIGRVVWTGKML
jgi:transcriptional regulator with XRE-family HTH domain